MDCCCKTAEWCLSKQLPSGGHGSRNIPKRHKSGREYGAALAIQVFKDRQNMPKPFRQFVIKHPLPLTIGHSAGAINTIGIASHFYWPLCTIPEVCDKKSEL
jgi:hypothetical protein